MNERLLGYLRTLGLQQDATDEQAWDFYRGLRGLQANIANALNYNVDDQQARTNCDLMIRALGYDPAHPDKLLTPERNEPHTGGDGASLAGDLEARARAEGAAAERQRVASIRQLADMAGTSAELRSQLESDSAITVEAARERIWQDHQSRTRANVAQDRPTGAAAGHVRNSQTGFTVEHLEAAMLHRSGINPVENWVREDNGTPVRRREINGNLARLAEESWQYRNLSMEDIVRMAARIDGITLPFGRQGLIEAYLRSGVSTNTLLNIYTTNMNSQLLAAFEVAPDSTGGGWIRESDVADFKTNERPRMVNGGALEKLPRGKEAEHTEFSDVVESFKIARYARKFVIDDQDIQDDSFGGTNEFVPADLGTAARQVRPDLVYSILMGNPAMRDSNNLFDASNHANYAASSGALAIATLSAGRAAIRKQTENGRNLNLAAKFLLVPPTLWDTAVALCYSDIVVTGANTTIPNMNANRRAGLMPVEEARLENGVIDPSSGTTHAGANDHWFLAASAAAHTIEVAYLRGTGRAPQVRPFVLTQGRWGLGWDVKMDIGAKALDWRGLYRSEA